MQNKNSIVFTGSFSTGKSTQLDSIKSRYPQDKFHFVEDGGRAYIPNFGKTPDQMTNEEKTELQLMVAEHYIRGESEGRALGKQVIMDASLIEAVAYSKNIIKSEIYTILNNILAQKSKNYIAIHLQPTVELEKDGVRHANEEYRIEIDRIITNLIQEHKIKVITITTDDFSLRRAMVDAVISHHTGINASLS